MSMLEPGAACGGQRIANPELEVISHSFTRISQNA
jgi:hypothetical protein